MESIYRPEKIQHWLKIGKSCEEYVSKAMVF